METQNIASDVSKTIRTKRSNKRFVFTNSKAKLFSVIFLSCDESLIDKEH